MTVAAIVPDPIAPTGRPTLEQWIKLLESKISQQKLYARPWESRYANEWVMPFIAREYQEVYGSRVDGLMGSLIEAPRTGAAAIGVDALVERLTVIGVSSDDKATAAAAKRIFEDNDLDVMGPEAHRETLVRGRGFGLVTTSPDGRAVATVESSEQVAIHRQSGPPYGVMAGMKIWVNEWTGRRESFLKIDNDDGGRSHTEWVLEEGAGYRVDAGNKTSTRWTPTKDPVDRPGPVAIVEFSAQPRLLLEPVSEIERIYTLVDMADLIDGLMVFAGHFGAVPIRWAKGLEFEIDPRTKMPKLGPDGKPLLGFKPRADQFWGTTSKEAEFGQMMPATLDPYVTWAQWVRNELRSVTKVAASYYNLDLKSHMTAELLKTDEAPMVRRVNRLGRDGTLNQSWRRWMGYATALEGFPGRVKPLWVDPQTRMEAAAVDAFGKAVAAGMDPKVAAEEFLGWEPDLAERAFAHVAAQQSEAEVALGILNPTTRANLKALPGGRANPPTGA